MYIYIYIYIKYILYALNLFIEYSGEHWWQQNIFCSLTTPQAFWQSSALGPLSTLVTSVVLYSLTRATLMSPGKDETPVCEYIYTYTYIIVQYTIYICSIAVCILITFLSYSWYFFFSTCTTPIVPRLLSFIFAQNILGKLAYEKA